MPTVGFGAGHSENGFSLLLSVGSLSWEESATGGGCKGRDWDHLEVTSLKCVPVNARF